MEYSEEIIDTFRINILNTYKETIADGEGIRYSIYLSGCIHACKGCHNIESWAPRSGQPLTQRMLDTIINEINNNPILDGITLSGGDPFFNPKALLALLKQFKKKTQQNIWCYTGYTYEQLLEDPLRKPCLQYIDTLVDGKFILEQFDPSIRFRGSTNQRLIYLQENSHLIDRIKD